MFKIYVNRIDEFISVEKSADADFDAGSKFLKLELFYFSFQDFFILLDDLV